MNQGFGGFNQGFGFGRGTQNTATTTSTNPWQNTPQQQSTFGFGQAPSAFGTPSQTPFGGFGQTQQAQATPQAGPSNAFGAKSTPFGSSFQPAGPSVGSGFGSSFNTQPSGFGVAGPSNAPAQITSTPSVQNINPRSTGTREPKFEPYKDREPTGVIQVFQNLTAMEQFRPWSPEELRLYDYELNRRPGVEQPLVSQPSQSLPSAINVSSQPFQFPQPTFQQQQHQQQQQQQQQVAQQPFLQQQQQQQPFVQSSFALGSSSFAPQQPGPFAQQFTQQPAQQPTQFAFQQNLQPQTPATIGGTLNPYNYQYTGNLYYRLHGMNNPPPLLFETKLKPDKGKGKDFTLPLQPLQPQQSQQQLGIIGPSSTIAGLPSASVTIGDISNISRANQIPKSTTPVPKVSFSVPNMFQSINATTQASILVPKTPDVIKPTIAATLKPAIKTSPTILLGTGSSIITEKPKEKDSDDEEFITEKKTRTTPLSPEELKTPTEADFPRRRRREPIYHSGILSPEDIKEPTWGYNKSYRRVVPKIPNFDSSGKDLLEQLKIRDKPTTTSKSLINTSTIEANKKKVPGSEVPSESDIEARLVYELLLKPRRDGPYAYRGEYDGTWSPLYGDGREEKPKCEPLKWKQQMYYKEYVKDVKRTKYPITEWRYEAPNWWDKHPYKPVPKELVKDMDQYDLSHEAFVEDLVVKMGLRPDPPKEQIDAINRQVIVKIVRVQKKPAEWKETKLVTELCNCCGTYVQKSKEEKMFFDKLYNPLIGGFESQPVSPTQPLVFIYAALPGEFEDRIPTYAELLNKYKAGIPKRNMYILDEPPRMPRIDFSNIIKGEIEFAKIVKEDVHKICHQDKKCDCPYAKKEPEVKQAQAIPRSHFYCYERLGKKPRENKPTTFQRVHGYQPFSKQKTPEPEENKPTKKHRILVPPQDDEF